jgi:hypothetical protein
MTSTPHVARATTLAFAALLGCGTSAPLDDAGEDLGADSPEPTDAFAAIADAVAPIDGGRDAFATPCASPEFGAIWGRVYDQRSRAPLEAATVCVANRPDLGCTATNGVGEYTFQCVAVGDAEVTFAASGYPSQRWAWSARRGTTEELSLGLLARADDTAFLAPTGESYPDGARSLIHLYFLGSADGAVVALRRGTGAGPFYTRYEGGTLDPTLTSVSSASENAYFLARAPAGEREIEIAVTPGPSATRCDHLYGGWAPTDGAPNGVRVPLDEGATSVLFVRCE